MSTSSKGEGVEARFFRAPKTENWDLKSPDICGWSLQFFNLRRAICGRPEIARSIILLLSIFPLLIPLRPSYLLAAMNQRHFFFVTNTHIAT